MLDGSTLGLGLSRREAVALAGFVCQQNDQPRRKLDAGPDPMAPALYPRLETAITAVILAAAAVKQDERAGVGLVVKRQALMAAIEALATSIEKEPSNAH
jgi:hypothetical protein